MKTHECPKRGCQLQVSYSQLACTTHWYELSRTLREAIRATSHLSVLHPKRREILSLALEELNDQ